MLILVLGKSVSGKTTLAEGLVNPAAVRYCSERGIAEPERSLTEPER